MRPVPITDEYLELGKRVVISAPDGDLTSDIRPVEALVGDHGIMMLIGLDDGDLQLLSEGKRIQLVLRTNVLPVFSVGIEGE